MKSLFLRALPYESIIQRKIIRNIAYTYLSRFHIRKIYTHVSGLSIITLFILRIITLIYSRL